MIKGICMKRQSLFSVIWLCSIITMSYISASSFNFEPISSNDLSKERQLFIRCWSAVYQDYSLQQLGVSDLSLLLDEAFDQEEYDYTHPVATRLFFRAIKDGVLVGYVSFEIRKEYAVYVKQYALLPEICSVEEFKELILMILDHVLDVSCLHMNLHNRATQYLDMSKEIGFIEQSHDESDLYVPLRMQFNRCGTCLCEIDDEDEDDSDYADPFIYGAGRFENDPESVSFRSEGDDESDQEQGCSKAGNVDGQA